ncbi:MAG: hypothetical protein GY810_26220 [Aureispira sp.]|nr:hypothetical protein [Aureispira sp.]
MAVTIKKQTTNIDIQGGDTSQAPVSGGGGLSKAEKEVIIKECLARVKALLEDKQRR